MANKRKLILLILFMFFQIKSLLAEDYKISKRQLENLNLVYNISKNLSASDGRTFEKEITSMALVESSGGLFKLGDNIDLDTNKKKKIEESSLGILQMKIDTARFLIKNVYSLKYLEDKSDIYISNKLLNDNVFATILSTYYVIYHYEKTNFNEEKALSRYNGGNYNEEYLERIKNKMKIVEKLIKDNLIKDLD